MAQKNYGLRLKLGGAPDTPHVISGVPGLYWPSAPTPVGGPGDAVTDEDAKRYSAQEGIPLELIEFPASERQMHEERIAAAMEEAMTGIASARRDGPEGNEADRINDQITAVKTAASPDTNNDPAAAGEDGGQ